MTCQFDTLALVRKQRVTKLYALCSAMMSSTVVLAMAVLMVTGPAGLA